MLTLTPAASEAVNSLMEVTEMPAGAGIRIAPVGVSEGHAELSIGLAEAPEAADDVVEHEGARVFVEPDVSPLLDDMLLDAWVDDGRVTFAVREPGDRLNGAGPAPA
jgi:Fe-S cluster assembly iron-binding protein IscA